MCCCVRLDNTQQGGRTRPGCSLSARFLINRTLGGVPLQIIAPTTLEVCISGVRSSAVPLYRHVEPGRSRTAAAGPVQEGAAQHSISKMPKTGRYWDLKTHLMMN